MNPSEYEPYENLPTRRPAQDDVHVWCVSLDVPEHGLSRFEQVLSADERARTDRFRFAVHRQHFVAARGVLRYLLSYYAEIGPAQIQFQQGPHGKPALVSPARVQFNVSHSGGLALYAVAPGHEVGIDIEQHKAMDDLEGVAKHYFATGELAELERVSAEDKKAAFFRCWSRKEAFVKAVGAGLSLPLDSFAVSIHEQPILTIRGTGVGGWALFDVTPREGYSAALATQGVPSAIRCGVVENTANLMDDLEATRERNRARRALHRC